MITLAVSDDDLFTGDLLGDDAGLNSFLDNPDGFSSLDQFTNDLSIENNFFDSDLLAGNFGVDEVQSCRHPDKKLKHRRSDGHSCTNFDAPSSSIFLPEKSIFLPEDERVVTELEVQQYWCFASIMAFTKFPVCSVDKNPYFDYYKTLESTLSQS